MPHFSNILGCLAGSSQHHPESNNGWEPFSNSSGGDDYCSGDWVDIIQRAKSMGVNVEFTRKGIFMSRGRSEGLFKDANGGVRLAEQFLEEIG